MNSKKNRPKFKEINARKEEERRQMRKALAELREECYSPAIQLELPFTYHERDYLYQALTDPRVINAANSFFAAADLLNEKVKLMENG